MFLLMQEGDNIAGNRPEPQMITMYLGIFLMIIFILVCIAIFVAFICYHAKDKKIKQLKKLIREQLNDKEVKIINIYRNLNDKDKQVIENTINTLNSTTPKQ